MSRADVDEVHHDLLASLHKALPDCDLCGGEGYEGREEARPICRRCGGEGVMLDLPPLSSRTFTYDWPPGEGPIVPGVDQGPSKPRERVRLREVTVTEFPGELPVVHAKGDVVRKDGERDQRRGYSSIASGLVDALILAAHYATPQGLDRMGS
jgi:hypothetical protein